MIYKFLLLLISFLMIISCSESDVSTTELAPTSTPIPVSTPLPDIKQVPTVEPIVEVQEEPKDDDFQEGITFKRNTPLNNLFIYKRDVGNTKDDDFQEGITFKRNIPTPIPTPKTYEEIMMAYEESQKKWSEEQAEELLRAKQRESLVKETFNSLDNPRRTSQYLGWGKFYDVESLRIFATERVTDEFMLRVVATYTLMFSKNDLIDDDLQNTFFKTIRDERVFQKILYLGKDNDYDETSNALTSRYPGGGYVHNSTGHLVDHGHQDSHRREIIGQSLRTIIFTLRLMSDDFDHKDPNSALSKAYQEAVDKNLFAFTPDRPEPAELFYDEAIIKFLTNVITTEWGNRHLYKIYADEKFNIKDKNELINKLPLSHKLYEEFIEKILNPIDHVLFEKINEYNFEPKVY